MAPTLADSHTPLLTILVVKYLPWSSAASACRMMLFTAILMAGEFLLPHSIDVHADTQDSEDCLHLNIYTPSLPASSTKNPKLKPVMFWQVVNINYRLHDLTHTGYMEVCEMWKRRWKETMNDFERWWV